MTARRDLCGPARRAAGAILLALALACLGGCAPPAKTGQTTSSTDTKEAPMTTSTQDKALQASITVVSPRLAAPDDLEVRVVLRNRSSEKIRVNGLFFPYATIMLDVRSLAGEPVRPGPPPLPPVDDGETGRFELAPGEETTLTYHGYGFFGIPPGPGRYEVRFVHESLEAGHGDWTGTLETPWAAFEIVEEGK